VKRYAITDRGKLILVMFAVLFIALPSIIIVAWIVTRDTTPKEQDNGLNTAIQNDVDLEDSEETPDTTSDFTQTPPDSYDGESEPRDPSTGDPEDLESNDGVLSFMYTPGLQTALDSDTFTNIGNFIFSPYYTEGKKVVIEMPRLPHDDGEILTAELIEVFVLHFVPLSDIVFFLYEPDPNAQEFEVTITFQ